MQEKNKIKIVLPVYNEEQELEENTLRLREFILKKMPELVFEIQIADNASNDKTSQIGQKLAKDYREISFFHLDQKGRGRAIKKTWGQNDADIYCYMDIDLSTDLNYLSSLLNPLKDHHFDIAIGSRLLKNSKVEKRTIKREIISRVYNLLIKILFGTKFSDAQCGFKAISRKTAEKLLPKIVDNEWFFDSELLIIGEKMGYKIFEIPVIWTDNPGSTVRVLKTAAGDLKGLLRLFFKRPWRYTPKTHICI